MLAKVHWPCASARCAIPISQFALNSLSRPRGPVCCCSATFTSPCSISIHFPLARISISGALESGSRLVPDALCRSTFSLSVAAGPPICICALSTGKAHSKNAVVHQRCIATSAAYTMQFYEAAGLAARCEKMNLQLFSGAICFGALEPAHQFRIPGGSPLTPCCGTRPATGDTRRKTTTNDQRKQHHHALRRKDPL
ncbi:hypothetical protein SBA5_430023 [Candidatus Sulfotelmatomonas gaucii]|uniref:Uncharacterized protein n=1 Tax=Candidatus Sulfuritelmatomonas gaucii TaxID=2043161 RepID=A0A2N9LLX0_9BACT|nr:hypothetical protein SBA5_430023 [Candidatus Sulfotelmatomonas gaucii]